MERQDVEGDRLIGKAALVVDQDPGVAPMILAALRKEGARVEHVGTFASAMKAIRAMGHFDYAVVRYELPDGSGLELVRMLRARGCRVAVVTRHPHKLQGAFVWEAGATLVADPPTCTGVVASHLRCSASRSPNAPRERGISRARAEWDLDELGAAYLRDVVAGYSDEEMARRNDIPVYKIKRLAKSVRARSGAGDRTELVLVLTALDVHESG